MAMEVAILTAAATAAGMFVAAWSAAALRSLFLAKDLAPVAALDTRTLLVALVLMGLTISCATAAPWFLVSRATPNDVLKRQSRAATRGTWLLRHAMLGGQLALVTLLLIGAGVFARSLRAARAVDLGIAPQRLVVTPLNLHAAGITSATLEATTRRVVDRVRAMPGTTAAAAVVGMTFLGQISYGVSVPGRDSLPSVLALRGIGLNIASPDIFTAAGIRLVRGRGFTEGDVASRRRVAVVSERMARAYWADSDPLGACLRVRADSIPCSEVIGIVADRRGIPPDTAPLAEYYIPLGAPDVPVEPQAAFSRRVLLTRVAGGEGAAARAIERVVREELPGLPLAESVLATDLVAPGYRAWSMGTALLVATALLGLLVAAVGVYGVISTLVNDRAREVAIRMAVGATPWRVAGELLSRLGAIVATSIATGMIATWGVARLVRALLFNVDPLDPTVAGATAAVLSVVALLASAIPARRAAATQPAQLLRVE
jgi:predicted permease